MLATVGRARDADSGILGDFAAELGVDVAEGTAIRLAPLDAPDESLDDRLFWRQSPFGTAASTFPVTVEIAGSRAIAPRQIVLADNLGLKTVYEPSGRVKIPNGTYRLVPGQIPITAADGRLTSTHAAVRIDEAGIRVLCAPVRFQGVTPGGVPTPVRLRVSDGKLSVLRGPGPYNPLVLWLPIDAAYDSSAGSFAIDSRGRLVPRKLAEGVTSTDGGFEITTPAQPRPDAPVVAADVLFLQFHRGRRVFAQTETVYARVFVPRGFTGATAAIRVDTHVLGHLVLPAVGGRAWDSRGFTLAACCLPPGEHILAADAADARCAPVRFSIVQWRRRSPFLIHTMSCCTGQWATDSDGLDLLRDAGLEMLTATGHRSVLNAQMPVPSPIAVAAAPPELTVARPPNDVLLEGLLAHRLRLIDLTVQRAAGFYNEGLSYHHSYPPSVARMIRRLSVFTQQTADYPSFWGGNDGWFPTLTGYIEGGVATDAHIGPRSQALTARLVEDGLAPVSRQEMDWYREHVDAEAPDERKRELNILKRKIAWWKAWNAHGFGDHNALYNAAVRLARPPTQCVLYDNAGHDFQKRARAEFNDMTAVAYESYTDHGEWPMSAAFSTDWARGSAPGKPVWLTVDWGTSSEGMFRSLFHAWARGLQGGGCPMQADVPRKELARRSRGLRLLQQLGTVSRYAQPDRRVGILATLSERILGTRAVYGYHALYYHLTRIGFPPVVVDAEDVVASTVPSDLKVLWIVRQRQPFTAPVVGALRAFRKRGGVLLATGDSRVPFADVPRIDGELLDIWRLHGFHPESHAAMWRQFVTVWREPLEQAMAATGLVPLAATDPERGLTVALDVGPVRYVVVNADAAGTHAREFRVTERLPVSFAGTGWMVRDVVRQTTVPATVRDGRTVITTDLVTEPLTIFALLPAAPAQIRIERGGTRFRAHVVAGNGADLGAIPLTFTFTAPDGAVREVLYRAAGDVVSFDVPALDQAGTWSLNVQELLTGHTATLTWTAQARIPDDAFAPLPDVQVVDDRALAAFAEARGETVVMVEPSQSELLPVAENLTDRLRAAGRDVRLWRLRPEEAVNVPMRWFPRPEDKVLRTQIAAGRLVGYRTDMDAYIDKKHRKHVPGRGGYRVIEPRWMLDRHAILFAGGRLADSLAAVTSWAPTPTVPGAGRGRLNVCFSPFTAGRHVCLVSGGDATGLAKAAERLAELLTATPGAKPDAPTSPVLMPAPAQAGTAPVPTPFVGFTPRRRVLQIAALPDGRAALRLKGRLDTLALVDAGGNVRWTRALKSGEISLDNHGTVWTYTVGDGAVRVRGVDATGTLSGGLVVAPGDPGGGRQPPNRSLAASYRIGADARTAVLGRFGGLWVGTLPGHSDERSATPADTGPWWFYDDLPHVRRRYEVWAPRFPVGMVLSPDAHCLFFTMDTRPTGFTNMSKYAFTPTGNEAVLLDLRSHQRLWTLRADRETYPEWTGQYYGNRIDSCAYVTHSGFAAVSRNGEITGLADFVGQCLLINKSGRIVWRHQAAAYTSQDRAARYRAGPAGGVGTWLAPNGELAAFGYSDKVVLAARARAVEVAVPALVSGAVLPDASGAVMATEAGDVLCFDANGARRWRFDTGGIAPRLAVVDPDHTLVATNTGELLRLDGDGTVVWRVDVAAAADRTRHEPEGPRLPLLHPVHYREPPTLAQAQKRLAARRVADWSPDTPGAPRFGRMFHPVTAPIMLQAGSHRDVFLHLVYRRAPETGKLEVAAGRAGGGRPDRFELDLPTPEFRVVDIPVRGPNARVQVRGEGAFEAAECALWAYAWSGPNIARIDPQAAMNSNSDGDADDELGDGLAALVADAADLAGALKDVKIYAWNSDPDKVQGEYLRPSMSPLRVVDGHRFGEDGKPAGLWSIQDIVGPWFTLAFPYPVALGLVATYDTALRQSRVSREIAVFHGFDPELNRDSGRVLAAAIENDQFWRLFPLAGARVNQLGVHVRAAQAPHGLSEVEIYAAPKAP